MPDTVPGVSNCVEFGAGKKIRFPVGSIAGNRIWAHPAASDNHNTSITLVMIDFRAVRFNRMIPIPWRPVREVFSGQALLLSLRTGWRLAFE